MDAVSDPTIQEIVVMSSAQVGKTLLLLAIIGYHIDQDPAPILLLQPTLEMAEAFSKDRLAPMVRDTPALRGRIKDPRSRDSGNTLLHKSYPGGQITMAGANSPASLASRPIRVVLGDEIDRYPASAGTEGDPVNLARKRTTTFWNRKIVLVSTPTIKGASRIEAAYEQSDKRRYFVPCPHCDHFHPLEWDNLRMEEDRPETAAMVCPSCGALYDDSHKLRMLRRGQWVATAPFNGVAGFHLNELYSPWRTFSDVASDYLRAKDHPEQLKTFVNTSLGETFQEVGEAPEWQRLYDKREGYPTNRVPAGVALITAGVDVQKDRLELEIVGWSQGKRSHSIDYRVILGDTEKTGDDGPWAELQRVINTEQWEREEGGTLGLKFTTIDSGYRTTIVYDFCRRFPLSKVAPIKGREDQAMVISPPRAIDRKKDGKAAWKGLKLYTVGTSAVKEELYAWLRLDKAEGQDAPPGYCHFPQYGESYFKELTSERAVIKVVRGVSRVMWVKTPGVRNEPLDCRVYARAAAAIVGMDRYKDRDWEALRASVEAPPKPKQKRQTAEPEGRAERQESTQSTGRPAIKRRPSSFL